jgi:PAS domain S-box-containing protein
MPKKPTYEKLEQRVKELEREASRCRRAEEALKGEQEKLRTILDSVPAGIVTIDAESHTIVDVNPAAVQMIGLPGNQITGQVCHNFICPEDKCSCPITDLGQTMDNSERVLIRRHGKTVPVLKTVASVIMDGRMYLIESFIDITERKRTEEERLKGEKLQAILEMAGAVCHELNQPIQAISGNSELMLMDLPEDSPLYEKTKTINGQIHRMGEITKKLMKITRYETEDYVGGTKIIDIEKSSEKSVEDDSEYDAS